MQVKIVKTTLALFCAAICVVALTVVATALLSDSASIDFSGVITTVDIRASISSIEWGALDPDETATTTFTLYNDGNVPLTLSMSLGNWNPTIAGDYITVSWNRENVVVNAGQNTVATLTIHIASDVAGFTSFSNEIVITGIE